MSTLRLEKWVDGRELLLPTSIGRRLDVIVALDCFGLSVQYRDGDGTQPVIRYKDDHFMRTGEDLCPSVPHYSSDVDANIFVRKWIASKGRHAILGFEDDPHPCVMWEEKEGMRVKVGSSFEEAICAAAIEIAKLMRA